jgi:5-methylcytosine-specific restriction endonuclease McrA
MDCIFGTVMRHYIQSKSNEEEMKKIKEFGKTDPWNIEELRNLILNRKEKPSRPILPNTPPQNLIVDETAPEKGETVNITPPIKTMCSEITKLFKLSLPTELFETCLQGIDLEAQINTVYQKDSEKVHDVKGILWRLRPCINQMIRRKKLTELQEKKLWLKRAESLDDPQGCIVCKTELKFGEQWHVGHNKPFASGGRTILSNLEVVCVECNRKMGTLSIEEYKAKLDLE